MMVLLGGISDLSLRFSLTISVANFLTPLVAHTLAMEANIFVRQEFGWCGVFCLLDHNIPLVFHDYES